MRKLMVVIAGLCLVQALAAAPAGWKVLHSVSKQGPTMADKPVRDGPCTLSVPSDWIDDPTVDRSQARSPDGRAQAFIQQWPTGPHMPTFEQRAHNTVNTYRQQVANNQRVDKNAVTDVRVLENSTTRLKVQRVTPKNMVTGEMTDWTVISAGSPICYAMVTVQAAESNASAEHNPAQRWLPAAQQIVDSFTAAK